jgi:hypothetical protein
MMYRKKVYVSPTIQGRLLAQLCFYWLLYNFLLWHGTFLIETLPATGVPGPLSERYSSFCSQHVIWLLCMLAAVPIILWDMVKLTHRVAGPLVRLERILREMARGQRVSQVTLRPNDMLDTFVEALNQLIDLHNQRLDARNESGHDWDPVEASSSESSFAAAAHLDH